MASSERGLGIVCAIITALGLVAKIQRKASVLRALDSFFLAFASGDRKLHCERRRRHPAIGNSRVRCIIAAAEPALLAVPRDTCEKPISLSTEP